MKGIIAAFCFALGFVAAALLWHEHSGGRHLQGHGSHGDHGNHGNDDAPGFDIMRAQLADGAGGNVSLRDINEGGDVLINFWATWCAPCVEEMPLFDAAARQMPDVKVVGITTDNRKDINAFLKKVRVEYPLYSAKFDIFYYFQANGNKTGVLPFTLLIDKNGKIKNKQLGEFPDIKSIMEFATVN